MCQRYPQCKYEINTKALNANNAFFSKPDLSTTDLQKWKEKASSDPYGAVISAVTTTEW